MTSTARRGSCGSSGSPGLALVSNATDYKALHDSGYLSANLLSLPISETVTDGGSNQVAQTNYAYDETGSPSGAHGNLTSIHRWLNTTGGYLVTTNVYNSNGLMLSVTDPKINQTTFGYLPYSCPGGTGYAGSGPTSITNALMQTTYYCYDLSTGLMTSTTDPNNQTTTRTWDCMLLSTATSY